MADRILSTSFRVGYRYRCRMIFDLDSYRPGQAQQAQIEWTPRVPRGLSPKELADYRRGRDAIYREVATALGIRVGIVETGDGTATVAAVLTPDAAAAGTLQ